MKNRLIICHRLQKEIAISEDAIENKQFGWICDCGNWTKEDENNHKIITIKIK